MTIIVRECTDWNTIYGVLTVPDGMTEKDIQCFISIKVGELQEEGIEDWTTEDVLCDEDTFPFKAEFTTAYGDVTI